MYLWNYWNVNVPLLPLIFKTKGYRCAGCTHTDTGPTGNGKGALISFFVMLQRVPPPCVFFWISLVHPSPTSLPFSARNSRIYNGTAQCGAEGWATINEWLFSIHCSHCGFYNWLHLWNKTITGGVIFLWQRERHKRMTGEERLTILTVEDLTADPQHKRYGFIKIKAINTLGLFYMICQLQHLCFLKLSVGMSKQTRWLWPHHTHLPA